MESIVSQSRNLCPFLHRTSPATLRTLSTATRPAPGPGGGTVSNLQIIAAKCPVMSKVLAAQGSPLGSIIGQKFGGNCSLRSKRYSQNRSYHSTGKKEAHVDAAQFHRK
ncbi:mitochondrial 5-aminolevulinate synthase, partial [Ascosphaera aggregata]